MAQTLVLESIEPGRTAQPFSRAPHVLGGIAAVVLALLFSGWAAVFALLTGYVIAGDWVAQRSGGPKQLATVVRRVAIPVGMVLMLVTTSVVGFLVAALIVPIPLLSERLVADAPGSTRNAARVLVSGPTIILVAGFTLVALLLL